MINLVLYVPKSIRNYNQMKQRSCKHKKGVNIGIRSLLSEEQRPKNPENKELKSRIVIKFRHEWNVNK